MKQFVNDTSENKWLRYISCSCVLAKTRHYYMQVDLPNGVQRVRRRFSLLDEIAATYKLFQIVVVRVLFEMIAEILALLLENIGHLFVDLLEKLIDLRQLFESCSLESISHLISRILTQRFSAILCQKASLG